MVKFINRCKMQIAYGGAGLITFGANAVAGFESLADQSVGAGDELRYTIQQDSEYEIGTGVIGLSGGTYTMTRTPLKTSNSDNSAISATTAAVCFFTMLADDVAQYLADLSNVSDTSPSAGQALTWDDAANVWKPASPSGGIVNVSTYANLPASPSVTDLAFVSDTKALYIYDGTEWDRVSTGTNEVPIITTEPATKVSLSIDGSTTSTVTMAATDPEGFPITYSYETNPSNQAQVTSITESGGVFTLTPSGTQSNAGAFTLRTKASDGVHVTTRNTEVKLQWGVSNVYGARFTVTSRSYGAHVQYVMLVGLNGNLFDDSTFLSEATYSTHQWEQGLKNNSNVTAYYRKYFDSQLPATFGHNIADTSDWNVAVASQSGDGYLDVRWTSPRILSGVLASGHSDNNYAYSKEGYVQLYIGGNTSSDLDSTQHVLTMGSTSDTGTGTANGVEISVHNRLYDFTA